MLYEVTYIKENSESISANNPMDAFIIATAKAKKLNKKVISIKPITK